jgi:Mrp family chromosome partitioning ATPase/capsular polysaccharide biosynthesis protein
MAADFQPSIFHYAGIIRRQAWLVILVVVVTVAAAGLALSQETSIYRASSKIVVGQNGGVFQAQFGNAVDPFTQTMTNLLKSEVVARRVIDNTNLNVTTGTLLKRTHVVARPNESVLEVSYDTPDRATAVPVLRQIDDVFAKLVKDRLGTVPTPTGSTGNGTTAPAPVTATVFDPPYLQADRISPRPARLLGLAGALGLILGIVFALIRDGLDQGVRSSKDAEDWFAAPVLGRLPRGVRGEKAAGIESTSRRPVEVDLALNLLKANLQLQHGSSNGTRSAGVILTTSARPDEGKSTVVANLGITLAQSGASVICVEADLRRPRLGHYFNLAPDALGLFDVFDERIGAVEALQRVPLRAVVGGGVEQAKQADLSVLGAGRSRGVSPSSLFTADRIEQLVARLKRRADYIIFDSPPLLVAADAYPIVLAADQVIAVARYRRTSRESAETLRETLAGLGAKRVGLVLMDWPREAGGYGYGYGPAA